MKNIKEKGQVMTPLPVVKQMLDMICFDGEVALHNSILEPSFGEGIFILEIIKRIIESGKTNNYTNNQIKNSILSNVYGIEKDEQLYEKTMEVVYRLLADYDFTDIDLSGNLVCGDTLLDEFKMHCFDFVIGNPPYVNTHNINNKEELIKYRFFQGGMSDLYLPFFEKGLEFLKSDGVLCYITPNSYFQSKAGKNMRETFVSQNLLHTILDFGHKRVFSNVTTYCCITVLHKKKQNNMVTYQFNDKIFHYHYEDFFINKNFYFGANKEFEDIISYKDTSFASVKNGYATLWDDFFIDSELTKLSKNTITVIKSSTGEKHKCYYPYHKDGTLFDFDTIKTDEPKVAEYLEKYEVKLKKRALEKPEYWYGFGRSQAILDTYKQKYAIRSLYKDTADVKLIKCRSGIGCYGGLYILSDEPQFVLEQILATDEFVHYVKIIGKYKSGGYYTVSSKDIEKYINYKIAKLRKERKL